MSMGFTRESDGANFDLGTSLWLSILLVAQEYGWKPEGTKPSDYMKECHGQDFCDKWDGNYDYNEYQIITAQDVKNLATALEKALPDIPLQTTKKYPTLRDIISRPDKFDPKSKAVTDGFRVSEEAIPISTEMILDMPLIPMEDWDAMKPLERLAGHRKIIETLIEYLRGGSDITIS